MHSSYEYAFNHPILEEVLNKLSMLQFFAENGVPISEEYKEATALNEQEIAHAALIASFLALSEDDRHKQKALAFGILLYLQQKENPQYASYCYIIFSRTGNLQQGKHLPLVIDEKGDCFKISFDEVLNAELSTKRAASTLQQGAESRIHLSDFQKKVWNELHTNKRIIGITGPTSSGKSFVIQSYVLELSKKKANFRVLYIVPTRALISEVSAKLRNNLFSSNVSVRIAVGDKNEEKEREVLVLTPERSLKLLRQGPDYRIDLIFCDEIQKLEDPERGVLLEYVLYELLHIYKSAKVVIAGPYLKNLKETIHEVSFLRSEAVESDLTPVFQLKSVFSVPSRKYEKISVLIKKGDRKNVPTSITIERPTNYKVKRQAEIVANIIDRYALKSNNVIYAPTRAKAEQIALSLAEITNEKNNPALDDLITLLGKEISPDFSLIRCLKHGIAYHHSMIPEMAKLEIEELYRTEVINNIACTTTLLEGVNLPADRVFIYRPWKRNSKFPLTGFDFGNLIGRAGRSDVKMNGSVYCIEVDKEKWANEKLDSDPKKKLTPTTTEVIAKKNDQLEENITKNSTQMFYADAKAATVFTILLLRQKALKDKSGEGSKELSRYLKRKELTDRQVNRITTAIGQSIGNLDIPYRITKLNPTIDPVLQNILYQEITKDRKNWIIDKKVREFPKDEDLFKSKYGEFYEKSFYYQFQDILMRLDNIFKIESLIISRQRYRKWFRPPSVYTLTYYAVNWIEEKHLCYIITKEQEEEEGKEKRVVDELKKIKELFKEDPARLEMERLKIVDKLIREVIEHINSNVRYYLAKYVKLWTDILDDSFTDEEREQYSLTLSIPEMLELGAYRPQVMTFIRAGIPRSAAIQAGYKLNKIDPNYKGDPIQWLIQNRKLLDSAYKKHLDRAGFGHD